MAFKFLDIIPKEHGAWAILLVPYLSGTFASGKPGVPAFLLLVCVISLYLLRGCAEFYLSNLIKKKEHYQNIKSFYFLTISFVALFLLTSTPLLFYFQLCNLLVLGLLAFLFISLYYLLILKKKNYRMSQQFIAFSGLTLSAPAAYYATTGKWDANIFILWIVNVIFFQLGMLYVHNRIGLNKKRGQIVHFLDKLRFARNLIWGWCFSVIIFYGLILAGLIHPVFFIILLPITIHIIAGIFFDKRDLKIKRMGYSLVGQNIFFTIILIYLFRLY
tara:strand:+ start:6233 stop:7054 length:822 start_codon:yes stop_codon:yes gene_type:complete